MELSSLDYVAQACMDLNEAMSTVQSEAERDTLIVNHIKKVWPTVIPIDDFKKNLEWVNVSEPISLAQHCADKVVILDFWTYCCINCYHVLPDLAHIEKLHKVENGLVVLGVHCAKFTNEKDSSKVLAAVQRYNIHHPVVNDADSYMWETMGIRCWPTLLILGPGNKPLFVLTGEGHKDELVWFVGNTLRHFGTRIATTPLPMSLSGQVKRKEEDMLYFPSKLALNPFYRGRTDEPFLAISDTGHHRVLLTDCSGIVLRIIGGCEPGFKDGKLVDAQFDSPQGLCWLSSNVLAVCDTNNHSVRAIHLDEGTVEVLAGTGQQGVYGDQGTKRCKRYYYTQRKSMMALTGAVFNLQSVTAESSLQEFLSTAELAQREPTWSPGITAEEEQITRERESFLDWRRHLNELQAKLGAAVTPYETKTLNCGSSCGGHLRSPMGSASVRCKESIVVQLNQQMSVKISEASEGSATKEEIDSETDSAISDHDPESEDDVIDPNDLNCTEKDIEMFKQQLGDLDKAVCNTANKIDKIQEVLERVVENLRLGKPVEDYPPSEIQEEVKEEQVQNSHEIFDREKLLEVLKRQNVEEKKNPPRLSVGMIGYPNVGKSSTVNVLMQTKKVSVSSMPGHTRHIQSLILDDDIELLDCPGLVLPAYAVAPDLLLTAVLPIDQMRAHDAAMARLCQLVPKHTFVEKYGLLLPDDGSKEPDYKQILTAHAYNRGFMTAAGQPDQSRSARIMLKEAASGRLRWAQLPPHCAPQPVDDMLRDRRNEKRKPTPMEARMVEGWKNKSSEIDKAFFAMQKSGAHVKGKPITGIVGVQSAEQQLSKPWKQEKKHANKNKREKLRRKYSHLDEH
ncbi:large subunit GTPase 1 homolog [Trichoplusia ni]|uniref:Large subunit GTPase 1 homolog n=1 Tax=Trichoplusia ni TaxID=7111 RepID=A0A7E5WC82_TRINI|nr:large subunit GTPase 1 homolog [Trichoplusia ni]